MIRSLRSSLLAALAFIALAAFAPAVRAAVFIPTKTADTADRACEPTDCSLREAILAANANPGEDVILLHAGVYALTLTGDEDLGAAGDLDIQSDLVLIGDGAGRTAIDGNGRDRIFQIAGGVTSEIRDVTLRNGRTTGAGGAILNNGRLTLTRGVVIGNSAKGDGGAIATSGSNSALTVAASTLTGNTTEARGGGIAFGGTAELVNTTVSGNRANLGGGLYVFSDARLTVNNVTLTDNSAVGQGGGAYLESAAFIGIPPRVTNTIFYANRAAADQDCSGAFESAYNLISNQAGCVGPSAANHDRLGSSFAPRLTILQDSGGPTPTHELATGSAAINAGNPAPPGSGNGACEATDQRGAPRPGGAGCDIGAFELSDLCVAGGRVLCLANGRFQVTAGWQAANASGPAQAVTLNNKSGFFWFFDPEIPDLTVKVVNGCATNGRYGFFASGMTSVRVELTVIDLKTRMTRIYINPKGRVFRSILDTNAFNTCP